MTTVVNNAMDNFDSEQKHDANVKAAKKYRILNKLEWEGIEDDLYEPECPPPPPSDLWLGTSF